jgi:hypothetical protein
MTKENEKTLKIVKSTWYVEALIIYTNNGSYTNSTLIIYLIALISDMYFQVSFLIGSCRGRSCVGLGWLAQETTRFILIRASGESYPTSSDLLPCSWARCARSRGYKLVGRGSSFPGPGRWCSILWRSNPCNCCPPLPFIVTRGGAQKWVTVLGSWHVPSYVAVRRGALKPTRDALSGKPPCGRVGLFPLGRLAFSPSSLGLS